MQRAPGRRAPRRGRTACRTDGAHRAASPSGRRSGCRADRSRGRRGRTGRRSTVRRRGRRCAIVGVDRRPAAVTSVAASSTPASSKDSRTTAIQYARPPDATPSRSDARRVVEAGAARLRRRRAPSASSTRPPGKTIHAGAERGLRRAPEHEHLDARRRAAVDRRVADQHHGGRGMDRHVGGDRSRCGRHRCPTVSIRSCAPAEPRRVRWRHGQPARPIRTAPNEPADVIDIVTPGTHLIVPLANGEPTAVLDAIEAAAADRALEHRRRSASTRCTRCTTGGTWPGRSATDCSHVSYFLSHVTRPHFAAGTIGLVPAHFSEVYQLMQMRAADPIVIAAAIAARPPRLLLARRVGRLHRELHRPRPVLPRGHRCDAADVRAQPDPRVAGRRLVPERPAAGRGSAEGSPARPIDGSPASSPSGSRTARRSRPGSAPSRTRSWRRCADHRDLGVHTELLSDGVVDLIEAGVVNGVRKRLNRTKTVGTFALGHRPAARVPAREHRRSSCTPCGT